MILNRSLGRWSRLSVVFKHADLNLELEAQLVRKCDREILPVLSMLYLFAFVERVNVGNARVQGLEGRE